MILGFILGFVVCVVFVHYLNKLIIKELMKVDPVVTTKYVEARKEFQKLIQYVLDSE